MRWAGASALTWSRRAREPIDLIAASRFYLTAYEEGRRALDTDSLKLNAFEPGALVRVGGRFWEVVDPLRRPLGLRQLLGSPVLRFGDLFKLALLDLRLRRGTATAAQGVSAQTSEEFLRHAGLSDRVLDRFFRPFFGGVFLNPSLRTPASMLRFTYRMFATGRAALPHAGMQALPDQLAGALPPEAIRLHTRVERVERGGVVLNNGERLAARAIVVATDGATAAQLLPTLTPTQWEETMTFYFSAPRAPVQRPILMLNGEDRGPLNHLAIVSNAQASYAPPGRSLICANVVGPLPDRDSETLKDEVCAQLGEWFGAQVEEWSLLRTYRIDQALPRFDDQSPHTTQQQARLGDRLYLCGDYREDASINGALRSGRRAAEQLLSDLR